MVQDDKPSTRMPAYGVIASTAGRRPVFAQKWAADLVMADVLAARREQGFALLAFTILPDQLQLLYVPRPGRRPEEAYRAVLASFQERWAWTYKRADAVWQGNVAESELRSEGDLETWLDRVHTAPVRARLVDDPADYPYSSFAKPDRTDLEAFRSGAWPEQVGTA